MADSPKEMHGAAKKWIADEVKKQVAPLNKSVEDVKRQNTEQSNLITMMIERLGRTEKWQRALWGNGVGPPGYLDNARKEDKEKYNCLLEIVDELKASVLREEGKTELRKELAVDCREQEQLTDIKKTNRLARFHYWWIILGSFCGAWFLSLIRPLLKELLDHLMRALQ